MEAALFLVLGLLIVLAFAATAMIVVSRAVGNLVDWLILTFGNEHAVEELTREKERL